VTAYRLARSGRVVLAVTLAAPFLASRSSWRVQTPARRRCRSRGPRPSCGPRAPTPGADGAAGGGDPDRGGGALVRGAREQTETHSATRELTEGMLADHLARGSGPGSPVKLHDVVAHHISMIAVQAETGRLTTPGLPDAGAQRFAAIGDTARAGLTEMRRLLGVLREDAEQDPEPQPDLEPAGPARTGADRRPQPGLPQLSDLVDGAGRIGQRGQADHVRPGGPAGSGRGAGRLPDLQEALTNARRHAPGAAVDVELRYADDALRLRIRDNGPRPGGPVSRRHGLLGMRERAAAVGGSLQTGDARGGGFLVEAELPARAPDALTGTPPERMHQ